MVYRLTEPHTVESTELANVELQRLAGNGADVPGIGDRAYLLTQSDLVMVWTRTANAITGIKYRGDPQTAIDLARRASGAVVTD